MKRNLLCGMLALGLAACSDPLVVVNQNSPDRSRTFTNGNDLEQFIAGLFAVNLLATTGGSNTGLHTQMLVMGMENHSNLANFAMGPRGQIPRNRFSNTPNAQGTEGAIHDWFRLHRAARQAALGIAAIQRLGTIGSAARDARAKAFARLNQGIALGYLSLDFDSASILTEADNPEADASVVVPLSGYRAVNAAALRYLDSAIAVAQAAPTGTFPLPTTAFLWFSGLAISQQEFIQIARSYKAKFRANVARTPAERADVTAGGIVDWAQVIADADAGITKDLRSNFDRQKGWDVSWVAQAFATGAANWHQMSQFWLGMADTSGGYDTWLAKARSSKDAFLVVTPDRRFPQGTSRGTSPVDPVTSVGTQVFNSPGPGASATQKDPIAWDSLPYLRNRPPGEDQPAEALQKSMYDFYRSRQFRNADRVGAYPVMTAAEIQLLAAEGYLRQGNILAASTRIDVTRKRAGLDSLSGIVLDSLTALPGGNHCVPRVPDETQSFTKSRCGRIWDALKWEYRLETMYTGYGNWFFPARGWGDLPEGTNVQWPVPWQEMNTRLEPFYGTGGVGDPGGAGPGNYGLRCGALFTC